MDLNRSAQGAASPATGGTPPVAVAGARLDAPRSEPTASAARGREATILVVSALVLIIAAISQPGTEVVHLFGHAIPGMCVFRATFGIPCPGCGMTRSFAFLAHGDLRDAFSMNVFGPAMFVLTAAQIPYRVLRIRRLVASSGRVTDGI